MPIMFAGLTDDQVPSLESGLAACNGVGRGIRRCRGWFSSPCPLFDCRQQNPVRNARIRRGRFLQEA